MYRRQGKSGLLPGAVVYEVYPRSYQAEGGSTGTINGLRSRVPYLAGLGVDVIWLTPVFPSPMADFGYDVADYCAIDPLFGSFADLQVLITEAGAAGIEIMLDLVVNHTSDQHLWFQESKKSRSNPRRDWYIWRDPAPDGGPPNNWLAVFGGPAWEYDDQTGQYYLHSFLKEQPDLNWECPQVQDAMREVIRFWGDQGVRLWRVDAADWAGKDLQEFRSNPPNPDFAPGGDPYHAQQQVYTIRRDNHFRYLGILAAELRKYDGFMIVETYPPGRVIAEEYRYIFDNYAVDVAAPLLLLPLVYRPFTAASLAESVHGIMEVLCADDLPVWVAGTHDVSRIASRLPDPEAARVVAMLLLLLPGVSVLYYGEEIGMTDGVIQPHEIQDPFEKRVPGKGLGRDPNRTPMQWTGGPYAGFSREIPWLPVAAGYQQVNVDVQAGAPRSMLALYRLLVELRATIPALREGSYSPLCTGHPDVFGFVRQGSGERFAVVLNISGTMVRCNLGLFRARLVLSTKLDLREQIFDPGADIVLRPWEGRLLLLQ